MLAIRSISPAAPGAGSTPAAYHAAYNSATFVATVAANWAANPGAGSTYTILSSYVTVGGSVGTGTAPVVTFGGALAATSEPLFTITGAGTLVPASSVSVAEIQPGGVNAVTNEVQTITDTETSGSYQFIFSGSTSTTLAFNASLATIQAALTAMGSIGANNVVVTGASPAAPVINFVAALKGAPQPLLTITGSNLAGGTFTIAESQVGGTTSNGLVHNTIGGTLSGSSFLSADEAQALPGATVGNYQLVFGGQTTVPIAFNATAATILTDLTNLSSINANNVTVTGGGAAGVPAVVTFIGTLADSAQPLLGITGSTLAGGTTTVSEIQAGGNAVTNEAQTLAPAGAGSYQLVFGGQTTVAIANTATPATIQAALTGLTSINPGNVVVTGTVAAPVVNFVGTLAGAAQPLLVFSNINLTGTVGVTESQTGGLTSVNPLSSTVNVKLTAGTITLPGANSVNSLVMAGGSLNLNGFNFNVGNLGGAAGGVAGEILSTSSAAITNTSPTGIGALSFGTTNAAEGLFLDQGNNQSQVLNLSGATGGTYTLSFTAIPENIGYAQPNLLTSVPIAFNASAATSSGRTGLQCRTSESTM